MKYMHGGISELFNYLMNHESRFMYFFKKDSYRITYRVLVSVSSKMIWLSKIYKVSRQKDSTSKIERQKFLKSLSVKNKYVRFSSDSKTAQARFHHSVKKAIIFVPDENVKQQERQKLKC